MAESSAPRRVDYPSASFASGPLYNYLFRLASALNELPTFSFFSGNPSSQLTANAGAVAVNIATSTDTSRLFVKYVGSGNTGWVSVATV